MQVGPHVFPLQQVTKQLNTGANMALGCAYSLSIFARLSNWFEFFSSWKRTRSKFSLYCFLTPEREGWMIFGFLDLPAAVAAPASPSPSAAAEAGPFCTKEKYN